MFMLTDSGSWHTDILNISRHHLAVHLLGPALMELAGHLVLILIWRVTHMMTVILQSNYFLASGGLVTGLLYTVH